MNFPDTVDEYMEQYKMTDTKQVYSNGIEYVPIFRMKQWFEHEKAQLSQEGTTFDMISRTEVVEHLRRMLESTVPNTDYDEGFIDGIEFGISTVSTMPTIQPEVLACGNGELVAKPEPTDIDAKEAVYNLAEKIGIHQLFALTVELRGEPIQPELTYEQVEEYCKRRCLHVVTDDFFESTKPQRLGHWIQYDKRSPWKNDFKCSECGNYLDFSGVNGGRGEANYCPNCGAKMTISTK